MLLSQLKAATRRALRDICFSVGQMGGGHRGEVFTARGRAIRVQSEKLQLEQPLTS